MKRSGIIAMPSRIWTSDRLHSRYGLYRIAMGPGKNPAKWMKLSAFHSRRTSHQTYDDFRVFPSPTPSSHVDVSSLLFVRESLLSLAAVFNLIPVLFFELPVLWNLKETDSRSFVGLDNFATWLAKCIFGSVKKSEARGLKQKFTKHRESVSFNLLFASLAVWL